MDVRKTTFLWSILTILAISTRGRGEQKSDVQPMTVANATSNPLILLPGMRTPAPATLPSGQIGTSISAPSMDAGLPVPLVSDFTNYPNPFDSRKEVTVIGFLLAQDSRSTLTIYDLFGNDVRSWNFSAGSNGGKAGANTLRWDGTNETGRKVSKGGYIAELQIESPNGTATALRKIGAIH